MNASRLAPLAAPVVALLALSACAVPTDAQRHQLDAMIGKSPVDVLRQFGVPQRTFQTNGHQFLAYIDSSSTISPGLGGGGWGWGWGGGPWGGWGGGGFGGWGGGWGGGYGGWGGGFGGLPSTVYNQSCQTTFEIVNDKVTGWTMRGDGC